jgi:hypothetical protein
LYIIGWSKATTFAVIVRAQADAWLGSSKTVQKIPITILRATPPIRDRRIALTDLLFTMTGSLIHLVSHCASMRGQLPYAKRTRLLLGGNIREFFRTRDARSMHDSPATRKRLDFYSV